MNESSWAAAGMLAAGDPENPAELCHLADLSTRLYPEYLRHIELLSAHPVPTRTSIALQGTSPDAPEYHCGRPLQPSELATLAPGILTSGRNFRVLDEASIDPRDLCAALPQAVRAANITLLEDTHVITARSRPDGIDIETTRGKISAEAFINCAGSWSPQIQSTLPVTPRKGQSLCVRLPPGVTLRCVIRTPELYLVPRGDGRVIIGATVEDTGFDKQVDPASIDSLWQQAAALWPPIASATLMESWAGLRPATSDGLPIIGPIAGHPNHYVATGHFRNGILLAPATAHLVSQLLRGLPTAIDIAPFRSQRFAPALANTLTNP